MSEPGEWTEADAEAYQRMMCGTDGHPGFEQVIGGAALVEAYRRAVIDVCQAQWKDDPETLNYLLSQLTGN